MNISARCEYALRAVVELAGNRQPGEPLTALTIARRRSIPEKYLVHILLQLKRAGIVRSFRGAQGGYMLARSADSINLFDVVSAVDGAVLDPLPVSGKGSEDLTPAWKDVAAEVGDALKGVSVQSIRERTAQPDMYYI